MVEEKQAPIRVTTLEGNEITVPFEIALPLMEMGMKAASIRWEGRLNKELLQQRNDFDRMLTFVCNTAMKAMDMSQTDGFRKQVEAHLIAMSERSAAYADTKNRLAERQKQKLIEQLIQQEEDGITVAKALEQGLLSWTGLRRSALYKHRLRALEIMAARSRQGRA